MDSPLFLLTACFFVAYFVSVQSFISQDDVKKHIHDLQAKLCTGKVPVEKLKKGEACHSKLVPPDIAPIIDKCEVKTKCTDIAKIKTGHPKHDMFLCCWCSDEQQKCLINDIMMAVMTFQINPMNLGKDLDALDEDIQCIAGTVGAKVESVSKAMG